MQQPKKIRHKPNSAQVIVRFCLRLSILIAFAVFASVGFSRGLIALLWMSALFTIYTGWDYFRAGIHHLIKEDEG